MDGLTRRRPSPALIVGIVALIAAMAGSAIALPGKNKVDKNDIKKNAVTSKSVKNNALKGTDVNESTLDEVPSAASAQSAAALAGQTNVFIKLATGEQQLIAEHGSVSLVAECTTDAGDDVVRILAATTQAGSVLEGNDDFYGTGTSTGTFGPTTAADAREFAHYSDTAGESGWDDSEEGSYVFGPDGVGLSTGDDYGGIQIGLNFAGADCIYAGVVNTVG